ncbi:serine protease 3-like [Cydia pomonella]|uniref:serine protease 3-like n=1 Tax=Cydia pomonella TaxID=82600 RepID=UPI002ADD94CC|nr:serine protease 3-like [Cydia pomonella]
MLFKAVFLIVGLSQVLALPTEPEYTKVDFIENVLKVEAGSELDAETSMSRIVSGWQAYPGQHPHQIYLRMVNAAGTMSACGGSVVHKNWFITAAHCTAQRVRLLVRAGLVHISQPQYDSETTVWYNYPTFIDELAAVVQPNDIAIAHVDEPFTFSHLLQPIKMQSSADAYRDYSNQQVMASGFGRVWTGGATAENLQWVYLTGVSNALCFSTFGTIVTDTTICARFFNVTSQSTCQGDSGGPLVNVDDDGVPILIGVAAFVAGGDSGCHAGHPAGFTRLGPFHSWFTEKTGIDFDNLEEDTEAPTEPPTERPTEPPTEPPTEAPTEPPTEPPTETPTEPPVTESPDSNESGEDESTEAPEPEEDSSEEKDSDESDSDDCELSELMKKLEVKVNVKVKLNKYGRKKKVHIKK